MSLPIRHAEKSRKSTSPLADIIANCCINKYKEIIPENIRLLYKQTVLAGFVLIKGLNTIEKVEVISLGIGTKVLPSSLIFEEECNINSGLHGGRRVRDCHAEILARRGLLKYLYQEANQLLSNSQSNWFMFNNNCQYPRIELKEDVSIHLYSSSQPCGNACIKRWGNNKPIHDSNLTNLPMYLSVNNKHDKFYITARNQGQIDLLVKKDSSMIPNSTANSISKFIPISCGTVESNSGIIMTCSDKIAKWNILGLQGGLLSHLYRPLYLSTITIGRKFSRIHCERAFCCRLEHSNYQDVCNNYDFNYYPHHPTMLGTAVVFDDSSIMTDSYLNCDVNNKLGADFNESMCICWSSKHDAVHYIDSKTGFEYSTSTISQISSYALFQDFIASQKLYHTLLNDLNGLLATSEYNKCKIELVGSDYYHRAKLNLSNHDNLFHNWIYNCTTNRLRKIVS